MKVAFLLPIVSPHELPLAKYMAMRLNPDSYRYVYEVISRGERIALGWDNTSIPVWCKPIDKSMDYLEKADVLYSGILDFSRFENRVLTNKFSIYVSERWLKPIQLPWGGCLFGIFKLCSRNFFRKVSNFVKLLKYDNVMYLAHGIHAARDMVRLCGLMNGDWKCLFRAPELDFEKKPGGRIWLREGVRNDAAREYVDKIRIWGYFVEEGKGKRAEGREKSSAFSEKECEGEGVKVLWVGRLLKLKRVDTIIKAVGECSKSNKITLDIYGLGPEEAKLKKLAEKYGDVIKFYPPVSISEVRKLMREHDVYVLASNGYEGWGAVVSEALEEGVRVIGTYEAGSSATILPESNLFHAGDWLELKERLVHLPVCMGIDNWNAKYAANVLKALVIENYREKGDF